MCPHWSPFAVLSSYSLFLVIPTIPVIPKPLYPPPPICSCNRLCLYVYMPVVKVQYMHQHTVSLQLCVCVCVCSLFQQTQSGALDLKCLVFTPLRLGIRAKWNTNFLCLCLSLSLSLSLSSPLCLSERRGLLNRSLPVLSLPQCISKNITYYWCNLLKEKVILSARF